MNATATANRRPYLRKKSDWARQQSQDFSRRAEDLRTRPVSSAREAGQREQAIRNLQSEAGRFANLANYYESQGL